MRLTNRYKKFLIVLFLILSLTCVGVIGYVLTQKDTTTDPRSGASTGANVVFTLETTSPQVNLNGEVQVNIIGTTSGSDIRVSAATLPFTYTPTTLDFNSAAALDNTNGLQANTACKTLPYLDTPIKAEADANGNGELTKVTIKPNASLPTGRFCVGTLTFTAKQAGTATVALKETTNALWRVSGPSTGYVIGTSSPSTLSITVGSNNSTTTTPTANPTATVSPSVTVTTSPTQTIAPTSTATNTPTQIVTATPTTSVSPTATSACVQSIRYAYNPSNRADCRTLTNSCVAVPQGFVVANSCPSVSSTSTITPTTTQPTVIPTTSVPPTNNGGNGGSLPDSGIEDNIIVFTILGFGFITAAYLISKTKKHI